MHRAAVLAMLAVGIVKTEKFCSLCADHTMCIYPEIGPKCTDTLARGVDKDDATSILDDHNRLRSRVATGQEDRGSKGGQPPAADMKTMVWDAELAAVAQRWTDQCDYGHDNCRDVGRFTVGQNVYISYGDCSQWKTKVNWSLPVESWYDEVKIFDRNSIQPYKFTLKTGHYTQLVWADTDRIGCGFMSFRSKTLCYNYLVCDYGPAGNMLGDAMYRHGKARSSCPDSPLNKRYPGLC